MTDEQKRMVAILRNGWCYYYRPTKSGYLSDMSGAPDKVADMIEQLSSEIESLRAENERIRQTSVTHEVYKMALDELETYKQSQHDLFMALCRTKRERNAAVFDMGKCVQKKYTSICCVCKYESKTCFENPCCECRKNNSKFDWRGVCAENGGK